MTDTTLRCTVCGSNDKATFWLALMNGWPKCCGLTMRLDTYPAPDAIEAATTRAIKFQLDYPKEVTNG